MKNYFVSLIVLLVIQSETAAQKVRLGVAGGPTISSISGKFEGESAISDPGLGISAGVVVDFPAGKKVNFQTGLHYIRKGALLEWQDWFGPEIKFKQKVGYLEIPLNLVYRIKNKNHWFLLGITPGIGVGINGKITSYDNGNESTGAIRFGNTANDDLKRVEASFGILFGMEWKNGLFLNLNPNIGINNLSTIDGEKLHHQYATLRIGYFLTKRVR